MFLGISPEQIPAISAKLGLTTADLVRAMGVAASAARPMPPGNDGASPKLPDVFGLYGESFFGCMEQGVSHRMVGIEAVSASAVSYSGEDIVDGAAVRSLSPMFD